MSIEICLRAVDETQTNPRSAKPFKNSNFPVERQEIRWISAGLLTRERPVRLSRPGEAEVLY